MTLARRARNSAIVLSTLKPRAARERPCSDAGFDSVPASTSLKPCAFRFRCASVWGDSRSATITLSMACAWSRSAATSSVDEAGSCLANASHASRISSSWSVMNADSRGISTVVVPGPLWSISDFCGIRAIGDQDSSRRGSDRSESERAIGGRRLTRRLIALDSSVWSN